ncbi:Transcriptional regulator [Labilithrix luteola]|uniref:Transcriptional regulator n=1 Tax=Labilithrix luteola TaxID=1391654 RepID=A0A0K1PL88_9BACT|nr:LysR family transcriptional regulator [Labilithrix luteola]AKU94171.1 Transcriptional regulator [Labilithrix luteola]
MHDVHLEGLDLNLLVALRALLTERHVTRAAARIGLTQPAMSHALARLRQLLGDPLLVRTASGMQPTPRAEAMRIPLDRALEELERVIARPAPFDPKTAKRQFTLATSDYVELTLFPRLVARLRAEAPGVDVRVLHLVERATGPLSEGRLDLAFGLTEVLVGPAAANGIRAQRIFDEKFVCVVRNGHPVVKRKLTLEDFVRLPHALVSLSGDPTGVVDEALAKIGKTRRVAVTVPHFLVAPHVVQDTDLVLTLAERVARMFSPMLGLAQFAPPLPIPGFAMSMVWHERMHSDSAHAWLRKVVKEEAKAL